MIKWLGYAPDIDSKTPGIFTDCTNVVPTYKGFASGPGIQQGLLAAALASTCQGAKLLTKNDGTVRFFAGSGTKMYEAAASSWTDRTRASGGDYSLAADERWRFAQFGDVSLAAAKTDTLQASTTGAFADISGAPQANIVEVVNNFVFLFDTTDATYGDAPNRWYCSALGDHTDWTVDVATQCNTGILTATSGTIYGAKRFGESIIAYKLKSMYYGVYVGPPNIWEFRLLPEDAGAISPEVIVDIGDSQNPKHLFMGFDDFYVFDGARATSIGENRVRNTVFSEIKRTKQHLALAIHDRVGSLVYFFYPTSDSNTPDACVVYNYRTNTWGRADRTITFGCEYQIAATTYADVGTLYSTYGDMPDVAYGSAFASEGAPAPALFGTDNKLYTLDGASVTSSLTTNEFGDDDQFSTLHRAKINYESNPTSSIMTNYYKLDSGDAMTTDTSTTVSSDRFDVLRSARWHQLGFTFTGNWEASGMRVGLRPDGTE